MNRSAVNLFCVALALGLAGCAATGSTFEGMRGDLPEIKPGEGRIFFYITEYPVRTGLIRVNGKRAGVLETMQFFYLDRPAGEYEIQVNRGLAGLVPMDKMTLNLSPGETRYIEVLGVDLRLRLLLVHPLDARETIRNCKYREPSAED